MSNTIGHFTGGKIISDGLRTQDVYNPSTSVVAKKVSLASKATVEAAVAAFPAWRQTLAARRARIMFRY